MFPALMRRIRDLFVWNVVVIIFTTALALSSFGSAPIFDRFGESPILFAVLSVAVLTRPEFIDVLPMYVVFLLVTPFVIHGVLQAS